MPHPSNLEYFKAEMLNKAGLSRPSRYNVTIELNEDKGTDKEKQRINFQPESLTLPSRTFITVADDLFGPRRNVPVGSDYSGTVVMLFPISDDFSERSFFEKWMDSMVNPYSQTANYTKYDSSHAFTPKNAPISSTHGTIIIETLNMQGNPSSTYVLNEAYPKEMIPVNMGASMVNDYTKLQVVIDYRNYSYTQEKYKTLEQDGDRPSRLPKGYHPSDYWNLNLTDAQRATINGF
jgi:hypothetical protein